MGLRILDAPADTAPHRYIAHVLGREFLLDRHTAAVLASNESVQPRGLPCERLPLELLWARRRERLDQFDDDDSVPMPLPSGGDLDLPDGVPPEELRPRPANGLPRTRIPAVPLLGW